MKVILREDVDALGNAGDIVKVAAGYARNYLIPQKLAVIATENNLKSLNHEKRILAHRITKAKREAEKLAEKLNTLSCTIAKQAGEGDKLFGSVTSMDIEESLKNEGFQIDRKKITLNEPIKHLGIYTVDIKLHPEVIAKLKIWVVKK